MVVGAQLASLDDLAVTTIRTLAMDAAPYADLRVKYGFTVDHVCERARALLAELEERS